MNFPLTYYVRFTYKHKEYSHQFKAEKVLNQEKIETEIEHFVSQKFGRDYDASEIFVSSYNYEES
jgi:hypothetical protein